MTAGKTKLGNPENDTAPAFNPGVRAHTLKDSARYSTKLAFKTVERVR